MLEQEGTVHTYTTREETEEKRCFLCHTTYTSGFTQQYNMELCRMCADHREISNAPAPRMSPGELELKLFRLFNATANELILEYPNQAAQLKTYIKYE